MMFKCSSRGFRLVTATITAALSMMLNSATEVSAADCARTITAKVVALDQPIMFNRIGAQNVNAMMYALRRDVVDMSGKPEADGGTLNPGGVQLRPDKRPRPLVLRMAVGDCLTVELTNLLANNDNPNNLGAVAPGMPFTVFVDDQVVDRHVGFHPQGLELVGGMESDSSMVGKNPGAAGSLADIGQTKVYKFYARSEGTFLVTSHGATIGSQGSGGNTAGGLFAAVNVQAAQGAKFYRSQVTEEELRLATTGNTAAGHPIINYEKLYPNDCPDGIWCKEGKADLPVISMLTAANELVHSDINAIVTGPGGAANPMLPAAAYPLESKGKRNPTVPNRLEPFREFTVIFHDEMVAGQAFPQWYADPVLRHTLHGVKDGFPINYGSGGIGSEIIANRLGVGPMHDCLNCAYEEFFLTAFTVGDVGMNVDVPATFGLEGCAPGPNGNLPALLQNCPATAAGPKATVAFFPDDPSNVHHSYTGDSVAFRNLHAGPKEQHVFHLHNHQWLFNANDDNSNYLDAQGIGPGSGYSYWVNFGGSGNRNKTAGDAIFHCHFYPHFAQGMWEMWRNHDVTETGTQLEVSGGATSFHVNPWDLADGTPREIAPGVRARSLPDGEIVAGTPIPAVVPIPGKPMAPMPGTVTVVANSHQTTASELHADPTVAGNPVPVGSLAKVDKTDTYPAGHPLADKIKNPGYPFWIAGIEHTVGQRPTTPPLDMQVDAAAANGGWDGGLPRHTLDGKAAGGVAVATQNRLDFTKIMKVAKPVYFPEGGTEVEKAVMDFHAYNGADGPYLPTFYPNGASATGANGFRVNGAPPVRGAPFSEPCIDDKGKLFTGSGKFFAGDSLNAFFDSPTPEHGATNPRVYKAANIQFDAVLNKAGYHFPQQRIITLWEDAVPTIDKLKPPEPFVIRMNTFDCTEYLHTNLVPEYYELDDYQVRTPTDIIGQHIHLPKWDLVAADGSANGWNYEDGTLSPGMVRERIEAINEYNLHHAPVLKDVENNDVRNSEGTVIGAHLEPLPHPFFGKYDRADWLGARTTIQRWFADPVVNVAGEDRGLGIIFTHDHYGPSTHQQVGLYATVLTEPYKSKWVHNETGTPMYTRADGGPTSWQAVIKDFPAGGVGQPASSKPFREFYFEFADFQHAYQPGVYVGGNQDGSPILSRTENDDGTLTGFVGNPNSFRDSINPSVKEEIAGDIPGNLPDIYRYPAQCPGGVPRPCPEAISADDPGMLVVNYRNEPVGLRVYDPKKDGPDGKKGTQADGLAGDLAFALQSRTDRKITAMNVQPTGTTTIDGTKFPPPINAGGVLPGDPFTPMMRVYPGDEVRVKMQSGAHEEEHNASIHGLAWLQGGSGHGRARNSGWRNSQAAGISEQFTFTMPVSADPQHKKGTNNAEDYLYTTHTGVDGWWSGVWGILRSHLGSSGPVENLYTIGFDKAPLVTNADQFAGVCPASPATVGLPPGKRIPDKLRTYTVVAMLANELLDNQLKVNILPNNDENDLEYKMTAAYQEGGRLDKNGGTLVYNPRTTSINNGKSGPLHDPTAIMYVNVDDLEAVPGQKGRVCDNSRDALGVVNPACKVRLKSGAPVEPLILRAAAGECVEVTLFNRLPEKMPDLGNLNTLMGVVSRDRNDPQGMTTFQNNLIRPSSHVGLHAQLVEYDVTQHDGVNVGTNLSGVEHEGNETVGPVTLESGKLKLGKSVTYRWYMGRVDPQPDGNGVMLNPTPIEFGGSNLNAADKVKQGQKGLIGALIVEPEGSAWATNDKTFDRQAGSGMRDTRASADVGPDLVGKKAQGGVDYPDGKPDEVQFRDFAVVMQKTLGHRYADGTLVENAGGGEGPGFAEDSQDMGQMGINYASEPLWFRFGLNPNSPFGKTGFGGVANAHEAYSNSLAGVGGDPVTPVFTAQPNQQARLRVLMPHGGGRGTTFNLHGHFWQRDPYVCPGSSYLGLSGYCMPTEVGSKAIGANPASMSLGGQESVNSHTHFEIVLQNTERPGSWGYPIRGGAGGNDAANLGCSASQPCDFLFRDQGSFGNLSGLWGILRVQP